MSDLSGSEVVNVRSSPVVDVQLELLEKDLTINYAEKNCIVNNTEFVW